MEDPQLPSTAIPLGPVNTQPRQHGGIAFSASTSGGLLSDTNPDSRLRSRLEDIIRERDNYQDLLRESVARIFDLENQLKLESAHPEVELLQQKALEMYRKSKSSIAALSSDIVELRQMHRTEKNEKTKLRLELVACQKELEMSKTRQRLLDNNMAESENTIKKLSDENFSLQQSLATAETTVAMLKQDRTIRMSDSQAAVERNLILAQKCEDLERKNSETMVKLEETVDVADKAVRARDQLAQRYREQAHEMDELREEERKTYRELTEKSKKDIQQVKQASEAVISQLRDDIRQMESKLTEKDIDLNRALREVKALQLHVDRVERDALAASREMATPDDVYRRLTAAEQDRDRLTLLVESTQALLKQKVEQMSHREAKFEKTMKDQNVRLKETVERCEQLNNEHVQMAEEIRRLEAELGAKERLLQVMNRDIQTEIVTMKEKAKTADAERIAREMAIEESQKQSLLDMQQVNKLLRQQVAHWQAEFNNLQNTNELRIRDLKEKLSLAKTREIMLENDVARLTALNGEMLARMEDVKNTMAAINTIV